MTSFKSHLAGSENIIISAEHLFILKIRWLKVLRDIIKEAGFTEVVVLIYFRDPISFYKSQVQQKLKASSTVLDPNDFSVDYFSIIERWRKFFPNIMVREFSDKALVNGNVVSDFLNQAALFFENDQLLDIKQTVSTNLSLSLEELIVIQNFRAMHCADSEDHFDKKTDRLMRGLKKIRKQAELTKPELKDDVKELLRFNNSEGVHRLRRKLDQRFFEGFYVTHKAPEFPELPHANVLDIFKVSEASSSQAMSLAIALLGDILSSDKPE